MIGNLWGGGGTPFVSEGLIKLFPYNHDISDISAGLNDTRKRDFVKVKTKIINLNCKFDHYTWNNLNIVDFYKILFPTRH